MSRRRTGYPEQSQEYYDRDWIKKRKGDTDDYMDRRIFTSSHGTQYVIGDSVLDICCGCGQVANMIDNREYLGIDFSTPQLTWAREHCQNPNAQFLQLDVRQMPEDIGKFDTVIMGETLEHFEDPESIVKLAHQHARKRIVITLPTKNGSCHVWENFEEEDIRKLLGDGHGGKVTVCEPFKCLLGSNRWVAVKELYSEEFLPRVLVTGASGFIGSHLVQYLKEKEYWVRAVDIRGPKYAPVLPDEFLLLDLRNREEAREAMQGVDWVFALASDHGGIGHITAHPAQVLWNNAMINLQTIGAAYGCGVDRYFFSSSVCIYPREIKLNPASIPLKEGDAYPAHPEHEYGWEKLFTEIAVSAVFKENARIARFHTIYGPWCEWEGGREKVTPALARKVAMAELTDNPTVEIWGDGQQTRTFCYVDEAIEMIYRLMWSGHSDPLNIGSDRLITIDELADIFARSAGIQIEKVHVSGPVGEMYRGADISRMCEILNYTPQIELEEGLAVLYQWVREQVESNNG